MADRNSVARNAVEKICISVLDLSILARHLHLVGQLQLVRRPNRIGSFAASKSKK